MKIFKTACLLIPLLCATSQVVLAQGDLMPPATVNSADVITIAPTPAPTSTPAPVQQMQPPAGLQTEEAAAPVETLPGEAPDTNYPTLSLTPDKSEILTLDKPARSVIVGNPAHLAAVMDSTKRLVLIPRQPGATYFVVLGDNGEVIMQRHVLVDAPQEHYVRVRKACSLSGGANCQPTQVYYCPGMCHEINVQTSGGGGVSANSVGVADTSTQPAEAEIEQLPQEEPAPAPEVTEENNGDVQ